MMPTLYIFVWFVATMLISAAVLYFMFMFAKEKPTKELFTPSSPIPKHIWTYWHDGDVPEIVLKCIDTWKTTNPDCKVTILNNKKVKELCNVDLSVITKNSPADLKIVRCADFARIFVVQKYGGFWMDSSIICTQSLEWIQDLAVKSRSELVGFSAPHSNSDRFPILENWFFAAIPESPFVTAWLAEALSMSEYETEKHYVDSIIMIKPYIDIQNLKDALPYLIMHLCATVVHQQNPASYHLHLMNSMDGPFKYLSHSKWMLPDAFNNLCNEESLQTPIIKMRGNERTYLTDNKVVCVNNNASPYIRLVLNSAF